MATTRLPLGGAPLAAGPAARLGGIQETVGKLVKADYRRSGWVSFHAYLVLITNLGWLVTLALATFMVGGQMAFLYSEFWVAKWAEAGHQEGSSGDQEGSS